MEVIGLDDHNLLLSPKLIHLLWITWGKETAMDTETNLILYVKKNI